MASTNPNRTHAIIWDFIAFSRTRTELISSYRISIRDVETESDCNIDWKIWTSSFRWRCQLIRSIALILYLISGKLLWMRWTEFDIAPNCAAIRAQIFRRMSLRSIVVRSKRLRYHPNHQELITRRCEVLPQPETSELKCTETPERRSATWFFRRWSWYPSEHIMFISVEIDLIHKQLNHW